jgi:hypothetical protein
MSRLFRPWSFMTIGLLVAAGAAYATPWELGIRGLGSGMPIEVRNTSTGQLIGTYTSHAPVSSGVNITIDFNGTAGSDIQLTPEVQYTFIFKNWSNKAAYVEGHMPPGIPNYDDIYDIGINPDRLTLDPNYGDGVQEMWGFPNATYNPPPPPPLSLTLVIYQTVPIGDKTNYKMRGTASGGSGSYTFVWSQATMTTGATVNPSLANRTCLNSQHVTVTCTVNGTVSQSVQIGGFDPKPGPIGSDEPAPVSAATWSAVKVLYQPEGR